MSNSTQHIGALADDSLPFSVWRETKILPRRKQAAFRALEEATRFAEIRARIEGENETSIDTTVWATCSDGAEALVSTHAPDATS